MRFCDYLRATVMLLSVSAITLLAIAIAAIVREDNGPLLVLTAIWNAVSVAIGLWIGRGAQPMESIRVLLSRSRPEPVFPKIEPGVVLLSRLWPVLALVVVAAVGSVLMASLPAVTAGYGLIWALAWRKQAGAVEAIEERDAVHFWIVRSGAFSRPKLVRVPAM